MLGRAEFGGEGVAEDDDVEEVAEEGGEEVEADGYLDLVEDVAENPHNTNPHSFPHIIKPHLRAPALSRRRRLLILTKFDRIDDVVRPRNSCVELEAQDAAGQVRHEQHNDPQLVDEFEH